MKKISLLLAVIMVLACFAACSNQTDKPDDTVITTAAAQDTTAPETENPYDDKGYLKDEIPEDLNFNTTIRILYWDDVQDIEFNIQEMNGEPVNDALYNKDQAVMGRLNVELEYNGTPGNYNNNEAYLNKVKNSISGGDNYDLIAAYSMTMANVAYNGLTKNLSNYPIIQFDKPWWPEKLIEQASIDGKLYFASGDISSNMLFTMSTFFFNKDILDEYKLESPYTLVLNNQWTFEKMFSMASTLGTPSELDPVYGFAVARDVYLDPFYFAADLNVLERNKDGKLVVCDCFHSEKAEEVFTSVYNFMHQPYSKNKNDAFYKGNALFGVDRARISCNELVNAEFEFGCVPMPKYTSDQENYITTLAFPYSMYAIASGTEKADAVAATIECMASEGYRKVTPALFEITMKTKHASDVTTAEMFDIIRSNVNFDLGRIYNALLDNVPYKNFRSGINSDTYTSFIARYEGCKVSFGKKVAALDEVMKGLEG